MFPEPVIIIGGGLVGLTLAQALKKKSIPCTVYERDNTIEIESGWAITVHWALKAIEECLPENIFERMDNIQVDPEQARHDTGRFLFLNLANGKPKYEIQPSKRMRINRQHLRLLLAEGLDIRLGKKLAHVEAQQGGDLATVSFEDGTTASSSLVIGCDGTNSTMRQLLFSADGHPEAAPVTQLPVRAMGTAVRMTEQQIQPLRAIDPLLFQGCHPDTGVLLWYSVLSTPPRNGSDTTPEPYYEGQIFMSWLPKSPSDDVPSTNEERREKMRAMAEVFDSRLRDAVNLIPADVPVKEVRIADWPTQPWPNCDGRVTLCGDAAHAMTMYRGEAYNHGVTDAANLVKELVRARDSNGSISMNEAVQNYEAEVLKRTHEAVLLSRQACLDAHDYNNLSPDSPVVSKRARILTPATAVSATAVSN